MGQLVIMQSAGELRLLEMGGNVLIRHLLHACLDKIGLLMVVRVCISDGAEYGIYDEDDDDDDDEMGGINNKPRLRTMICCLLWTSFVAWGPPGSASRNPVVDSCLFGGEGGGAG
jgi:hypothetical protein